MQALKVNQLALQSAGKDLLKTMSFDLPMGKKVALVGLNGAGKSSLLKLLVGELKPSSGQIRFDLGLTSEKKVKDQLGYQAASMQAISNLSVKDYLSLCVELKSSLKKSAEQVIQQAIETWHLKVVIDQPINQLSQGNLQKLMIAQAFLGQPRYIILDEPSQALDPIEQVRLKEQLLSISSEQLLVFSSHHINEIVEVADLVMILHHGELIAILNLQMKNEFWLVTTLNLEQVKQACSQVKLELIFQKKNQLIKFYDLSLNDWKKIIEQLKPQDEHLIALGESHEAMMPLFSLLVNESL